MNNIFNYSADNFKSYLFAEQQEAFILDLSKATVLEVINEYTNIRVKLSPRFKKSYSCLVHNLQLIQSEFGCTLMPIQITDVFWYNFAAFLVSKGLAVSSIQTLCSQLLSAIQWGAKHKAPIAQSLDLFVMPSFKRQQIALSQDDISRIYHFDLRTTGKRSQYVRNLTHIKDMFVLSCNLGQRHSDMVRIEKSHFNRNIFTIVQQKTGNTARVDIDKFALDPKTVYAILEKYNYKAPYPGDISSYNKYLKKLMIHVGLNDIVKREERIAGTIKSEYCEKYKLVSSHTARRTFATVNVLRGHRYVDIRRATGHKSESGFEKYICYGIDY